jgi:hypothetical protein
MPMFSPSSISLSQSAKSTMDKFIHRENMALFKNASRSRTPKRSEKYSRSC